MGGSYARAEKPEIQESGRPEGLPRTAAIARVCRHKKAPAIVIGGACAPVFYPGSQARSLNWQRRGAKLAGKDEVGNRSDLVAGDGRDTAGPVGAGLPAMAVCQATLMLDVTASSLASQLPQDR